MLSCAAFTAHVLKSVGSSLGSRISILSHQKRAILRRVSFSSIRCGLTSSSILTNLPVNNGQNFNKKMGSNKDEKIIVIDTDAGTDDAMALFVALAAHNDPDIPVRVVGITCVMGNTSLENVCINVTRTLQVANMLGKIPIYKGCGTSMAIPYRLGKHKPPYHGFDGFGDADLPKIEPCLEKENGVLALIRLAKEYKGRLSILALGPLTNLAMAVRLDPSIKDDVKEIYLMGGNCEGVGNTTVCGEFNFVVDPEAAFVTLSAYPCPIVVVPWELCKREGHHFYEFRTEVLGKVDTPAVRLLNVIEANHLSRPAHRWFACDSWAAAILIDGSLAKTWTDIHATVELAGKHSRGLMVIDHDHQMGKPKNKRIIRTVDVEACKRMLLWAVGGGSYKLG